MLMSFELDGFEKGIVSYNVDDVIGIHVIVKGIIRKHYNVILEVKLGPTLLSAREHILFDTDDYVEAEGYKDSIMKEING